MRNIIAALGLAALIACPALAQEEAPAPVEPDPTLQSIAMELFGLANQSIRVEDYEAARRSLEGALALKPGHPAVLRGLFRVALRAGRPADGLTALEAMATAGLSLDSGTDTGFLADFDPERLTAVLQRLEANAAPAGRAERAAVINRPDALIEGVAIDIETDRLFVSSVIGREILVVEPFDRNTPIVFADRSDGLWSVFGIAVDDRNRMVWAASATIEQTPMDAEEEGGTALFAFDLSSGELYRRYQIEGARQLADFVVRDGTVYVSDAQAPRIYVLDSISGQLELLVEDPRFVSLQGLALSRGALYAADYSLGIWRIDLGDRSVSLVHPGEASLIGIDGLLNTRDGRLIAVRNGAPPHQVMAIDLDRSGHAVEAVEIILRGHPDMTDGTEPTLIDLADGRGWLVANAAWPLFTDTDAGATIGRPATIILEVDLE